MPALEEHETIWISMVYLPFPPALNPLPLFNGIERFVEILGDLGEIKSSFIQRVVVEFSNFIRDIWLQGKVLVRSETFS